MKSGKDGEGRAGSMHQRCVPVCQGLNISDRNKQGKASRQPQWAGAAAKEELFFFFQGRSQESEGPWMFADLTTVAKKHILPSRLGK